MKRFAMSVGATAAILVGLAASVALAAPATTTANVNMRQGPGTQYAVISTLPAQAGVDVEGCENGWCKVSYSGGSGWVSEPYLQGLSNPPVIAPPPIVVQPTIVVGPGRRHHWRPPHHHRPPIVQPRPPHHRPPIVKPRPPHHRPPGGGRPHRPQPRQ